tara:strand:+ start:50 stop:346 length:297 start_codon:yes stop_codon:yes gene_type:complete
VSFPKPKKNRLAKLNPILDELRRRKNITELVFTIDRENQNTQRTMPYHWQKMIELADIADRETRELVPYSLRHFMITQRILCLTLSIIGIVRLEEDTR